MLVKISCIMDGSFFSCKHMPLSMLALLISLHFCNEANAANVRRKDVSLLEIEAEVEDLRTLIAEQEKIVNLLKGSDCPPESPTCLQKRTSYAQRLHRKLVIHLSLCMICTPPKSLLLFLAGGS